MASPAKRIGAKRSEKGTGVSVASLLKAAAPAPPPTLTWASSGSAASVELPRVPDPEIEARLKDPEQFGGVVSVSKWIVNRLKQTGLAHEVQLAPKNLGVHPCNRGKYGVNEESVHNLGKDILEVGWDADAIINPWCVEEDPNDRYIEAYNAELAKNIEFLALVEPNSIRAGTLTNGHTVLVLRCILAGVKCSLPALAVDGRMSFAHVEHRDQAMAQAAMQGWQWTLLHHHTRKIYGDPLFEFLSEAKNVQLQRSESEAGNVSNRTTMFKSICTYVCKLVAETVSAPLGASLVENIQLGLRLQTVWQANRVGCHSSVGCSHEALVCRVYTNLDPLRETVCRKPNRAVRDRFHSVPS